MFACVCVFPAQHDDDGMAGKLAGKDLDSQIPDTGHKKVAELGVAIDWDILTR